ncbi:hypothetical protein [Streptomyces sp. NPDC057740]
MDQRVDPDPRLVDNLEGAKKKRSADKEAVKRALADAKKRKKDLVTGS